MDGIDGDAQTAELVGLIWLCSSLLTLRTAFGVVFTALHSTPSLAMQVLREIAVMKRLSHENVVRLFEVLLSG